MVKGVKFLSRLLNASYSPSYFFASNPNSPRPLSSFDTHARWRPVTQKIRSLRSHGKIGDCEQSIDVSEPLLKTDAFTLILESDHLVFNLHLILTLFWGRRLRAVPQCTYVSFPLFSKRKEKRTWERVRSEIEKFLFISKGTHPRLHLMTWTTCMYAWTAERPFTAVYSPKLSSLPSPLESVS